MDVVQKTQHPLGTPEHLSAFVIGHLFNALVGVSYGRAKSPSSEELVTSLDKMLMWYKAYRCVLSTHLNEFQHSACVELCNRGSS